MIAIGEGCSVREALRSAMVALAGDASANLDAQLLLAEALGVERSAIIAHPEWTIGALAEERFRSWLARRVRGEPLAYILERRAFYDREFRVTPATLIPRPETEILLVAALSSVERLGSGITFVDIGTGCGALALCFAAKRPAARVIGCDISAAALAIAQENATAHDLVVEWRHGDLLAPIREEGLRVQRVVANLPYISRAELPTLSVSQYEPWLALDGGEGGLELIDRFLVELPIVSASRAQAWLEIGAGQGGAVQQLVFKRLPAARALLLRDYAGHDRVLHLQMP